MPDDWNGVEADGLKAENTKLYKSFKFRKCKGYEVIKLLLEVLHIRKDDTPRVTL